MNYAILRTKKLKEWGNIRASLEHNFRERITPNADREMTIRNEHLGGYSSDQVCEKIASSLPEKYRADCVKCIEYMITASPEWFETADKEKQTKFFRQSLDWLYERHGTDNVKLVSVHNDETTPHLVAYVVPLDERGKLNAKKWLGSKKILSEMQSDFADRVSNLGLSRGIEGSKSKHQRVQRFYGNLKENEPKITLEDLERKVVKKGGLFSKDELETLGDVANRINSKVIAKLDKKTQEIEFLKKKLDKAQREIEKLSIKAHKNDFKREITKSNSKVAIDDKNRNTDDLKRKSKSFKI